MTDIEWADKTWNPVDGCTKVSPGCANCYAERWMGRFDQYRSFEDVRCHPDRLDIPLHWRKPRSIFVCSMGDLFHEDVPDSFIDRVFAVMALADKHTYLLLTKRPERMRKYVGGGGLQEQARWQRVLIAAADQAQIPYGAPDEAMWAIIEKVPGLKWPLPNVWLGTSIEDQKRADERLPELLATPAAGYFVSCEPLLSEIDIRRFTEFWALPADDGRSFAAGLDWVIAGGESGPGARFVESDGGHVSYIGSIPSIGGSASMHGWTDEPEVIGWLRSLRDQCAAAGVSYFVKQLGGMRDKRGGAKALLDGRLHHDRPEGMP